MCVRCFCCGTPYWLHTRCIGICVFQHSLFPISPSNITPQDIRTLEGVFSFRLFLINHKLWLYLRWAGLEAPKMFICVLLWVPGGITHMVLKENCHISSRVSVDQGTFESLSKLCSKKIPLSDVLRFWCLVRNLEQCYPSTTKGPRGTCPWRIGAYSLEKWLH